MPSPIQTTSGPIDDASALGRTLGHEHLLSVHEGLRFQWPHLVDRDDERRRAIEAVRSVQEHGVETIVDPSCLDLGRDVRLNLEVAEETGMRFVMATGVYGQHYTFLPHFFQTRDISVLVDCLVHDLTEGIQGTDVRAHFLKCAADEPGLTDDVEKVHRAVAQASLRTGAPIMAHSRPASRTGLEQMRVFTEEGVDPAKVQIAHTGDTDDLDHIEELLQTGCTIGMDRFGLDLFLPREQRYATVRALCERGHAGRMVLSQDFCAYIDWYAEEVKPVLAPDWSMDHLFTTAIPAMLELGVAREDIDAMIGANVHRWLAA